MFKTLAAAAVITFCISRRLPQPTLASSYEPMHCDDTQASCSQHSFQQTNTGTNQTTTTNLKWVSQAQNQIQLHIKEMHNHQTNHQQLTIKRAPYRQTPKITTTSKHRKTNKKEQKHQPTNKRDKQTRKDTQTHLPSGCRPGACRLVAATLLHVMRLLSGCSLAAFCFMQGCCLVPLRMVAPWLPACFRLPRSVPIVVLLFSGRFLIAVQTELAGLLLHPPRLPVLFPLPFRLPSMLYPRALRSLLDCSPVAFQLFPVVVLLSCDCFRFVFRLF